jgi:hypothetical protein
MEPHDDITPRILKFFDHPRFRGLWYVKRKGEPKHWTVTYVGDDGEYWETEDTVSWREAVFMAMKECGA